MTTKNNTEMLSIEHKLTRFFELNPASSLEMEGDKIIIRRPWDDESVGLVVTEDNNELICGLNELILLPPLTALFHTDTNQLEFIFSVRPNNELLWKRNFDFIHGGETYHCKYSESSKRLLQIAISMISLKLVSASDNRNLVIFHDYCKVEEFPDRLQKFFENRTPMSFFIEPITNTETDAIIEFAKHLNFFMFYFDRATPQIVVHRPEDTHPAIYEEDENVEETEFPNQLVSSKIDTYLLDLWEAAQNVTGRLAFIYYYQLIEYAAFYYVEERVKLNLAKIVRRPDILSSLDTCLPLIVDEIVNYRQSDDQKLTSVVQRCVNQSKLWNTVNGYKDYFSETHEFDGGFISPSLIKNGWAEDDFIAAWMPKLPDALRKIRNALVHSREYRMGHVIAPTRANSIRLHPWVSVIEEVACQVAIYRNI